MSTVQQLVCVQCDARFSEGACSTCPACGADEGILDVQLDLARASAMMTRAALAARPANIWRYRELLPVDDVPPGLGDIGWTPVIEAPRLAAELGVGRVRIKDEGRNASGSFKDRASAVAVARALSEKSLAAIACASTGNAATSLARCAASVGMEANIFVSRAVPEGKLAQLLAYGARVFCVDGSYADAYTLCTEACERFGWYNRNCAVNPYLVEGKKTGGLELAEQCADDPPAWVATSVGDGCSIAGIHKGICQMHAVNVTGWQARMLGVQAESVAPVALALATGRMEPGGSGTTYADSINVAVPRNWRKAVNAVRASDGTIVTVSDEAIMKAMAACGRLTGVFAEPAAAAAVAGVAAARRQGVLGADASVLIMITGTGLKDIQGALRGLPAPHRVRPALAEVERVCEGTDERA